MNMFLHNINYDKFHIALGNTLLEPHFGDEKPFDAIVSNPPYSVNWIGSDDSTLINDDRFAPAGVLAPNLFYGTSIAVNILVLSKHKEDNKTQFIDASGEDFYKKETNNNIFTNDYNLSVSSYVEAKGTREVIDILALNSEIREIVAREQVLRDEIDKIIMEIEVGE